MSLEVITWAFKKTVEDPRAKLVLLALADHANDHGLCWPGQDHLMVKASSSRRTIAYKLRYLVELGLLGVVDRRATCQTAYYILNVNELPIPDFANHVQNLQEVYDETGELLQPCAKSSPTMCKIEHDHVQLLAHQEPPTNRKKNRNQLGTKDSIGRQAEEFDQRQVIAEHDFCSDDGSVVFTVEEFQELERRHPEIKNVRGLLRQACRSWLLTHDAEDRKRRFIEWLAIKQPKTLKVRPDKQTREERAQDVAQKLRETLPQYEERQRALEVRARLQRQREERMAKEQELAKQGA